MEKNFIIEIDHIHWNCGDGCCFDDWFNIDVMTCDGHTVLEWDECKFNDKEHAQEFAVKELGNHFCDLIITMDEIDIKHDEDWG